MNSVQILLDLFWITKHQDKELYFAVKRDLESVQKFVREYPGWRLVQNEHLIRLEKIPARAEAFMGIEAFTSVTDYMMLAALLIFLEDLEENEAFLLSELTDRIEVQLRHVQEVDWTLFSNRKSLIRVIQWAEETGLLITHEGNLERFSGGTGEEVLYENTGLSRYLALSYPFDTSKLETADDYEHMEIADTDTDRGHFRINRVYRKLLLSPAMYWEGLEDADAAYLKNQRAWVTKHLFDHTGYRLDIHRNAAFLLKEEEAGRFGELFPDTSTLSDIVLMICTMCRKAFPEHREDDSVVCSVREFHDVIDECAKKYSPLWSKEYRELSSDVLKKRITELMKDWMMLEEADDGIILHPACFLLAGDYGEVLERSGKKKQEAEEEQLALF